MCRMNTIDIFYGGNYGGNYGKETEGNQGQAL